MAEAWAADRAPARLFIPATGAGALLGVNTSAVTPHLGLSARLSVDLANDELAGRRSDDTWYRPLAFRAIAEPSLALGLFDWLELSAGMPLTLLQRSENQLFTTTGEPESASGWGDLRLGAKLSLLGDPSSSGVGLALVLPLTVPTSRDEAFMGETGFSASPVLALDLHSQSGYVLALNAGYRWRQGAQVRDLLIDDELLLSLGGEAPLAFHGLSLLAEVDAAIGLEEQPDGAGIAERTSPVEARGALRWRHSSGFSLTCGFGAGVTSGYGAPDQRFMLGLGYQTAKTKAPSAPAPERAKAVSRDARARAASRAAADDGLRPGSALARSTRPAPSAAAFDAFIAEDPDPDADGLRLADDRCPQAAEDLDGVDDEDGCPDLDDDGDGIPDLSDKCPREPETINGNEDEDGCPDEGEARVHVTSTAIENLERIYFETGRDLIERRSWRLLRQVAAVLKANPGIQHCVIEGHTDDAGHPDKNVWLSARRAQAVLRFLVDRGVDAKRLIARGFGATRPLNDNKTNADRALNRRVEFRIVPIEETQERAPVTPAPTGATPPQVDGSKGGAP